MLGGGAGKLDFGGPKFPGKEGGYPNQATKIPKQYLGHRCDPSSSFFLFGTVNWYVPFHSTISLLKKGWGQKYQRLKRVAVIHSGVACGSLRLLLGSIQSVSASFSRLLSSLRCCDLAGRYASAATGVDWRACSAFHGALTARAGSASVAAS